MSDSEARYMRRQWETIIMQMEMLTRNTDAGRIEIVCRDETHLAVIYPQGSSDVEMLGVIAQKNQADVLRETWPYARNPAKGKFFGVQAADVIEFLRVHGGIDMRQSRELTRAGEQNMTVMEMGRRESCV